MISQPFKSVDKVPSSIMLTCIAFSPALNAPGINVSPARTLRVVSPVMQWRDVARDPIQPPGWGHDFKQEAGGTMYRAGKLNVVRDTGRARAATMDPTARTRRADSRSGTDRTDRFTGGVSPTSAGLGPSAGFEEPLGFGGPPGFGGAPPSGFGGPTMTESDVLRLKQEVNEAEAVLAGLLQEMNAEKSKFKEEGANHGPHRTKTPDPHTKLPLSTHTHSTLPCPHLPPPRFAELRSDVTSDRYNAILTAHVQQWQNHKLQYDEAHRVVAGKKREAELASQLLAAEQSTRAKQVPEHIAPSRHSSLTTTHHSRHTRPSHFTRASARPRSCTPSTARMPVTTPPFPSLSLPSPDPHPPPSTQAKAEATEEQLRTAHQEREEAAREEQKLREQQGRAHYPTAPRYPSEKYQQRGYEQRGGPQQQQQQQAGGVGQQQQAGMPYHTTSKAEFHRLRRAGMIAPQNQNPGFSQQGMGGFPQPGMGHYPQQDGFPPYQGVPYQGGPFQQQQGMGRYQQQGGFPLQQGMGRYQQGMGMGYEGGYPGGFQDGRPGGYQRYSTEGGYGAAAC